MMKQLQLSYMSCLPPVMLVSVSLLLYAVNKSLDGPSGGQSIVNSFELKTNGSDFSGPLKTYVKFLLMGLMISYGLMKRLFNWRAIKGIRTGKRDSRSTEATPKTPHQSSCLGRHQQKGKDTHHNF